MSGPLVLKIGSSVLLGPESVAAVAAAIGRRAAAQPVLAVVSAFAGETDRRLAAARAAWALGDGAERARRELPRPFAECVAAAVAIGEIAAASELALALAASGIAAAMGEPRRILSIAGDRLDGRPDSVDGAELARLLARSRLAIVPGFFGESVEGGAALLGRGGSDLSALLFAHALGGARCRLAKDVDGIYELDPASARSSRRFRTLSYASAARVAGRLVQPKAIRFARSRRLTFEVGTLASEGGTRVGPFVDAFDPVSEGAEEREEAVCA